ncbi:alpha-glucan family phosphorylase [Candidatus Peregrinibacteria bacterium]|jgi:glycogen phosphorylase|nr:alpha-glucan family phosphorylase [Candidatus Peregrinibacteria bacterium]MBT3598948.1 alpha-glucan family phosphorylase [Candidatus Peregrinibacteria bacterium]MBT4367499.1 alpha-glucan family phosphorylase [Candidatus Peregrinibacteria bacterium]MBT4585894.1 alpha-glucan family phosphorylase [Candidatus Peregrinibacteria bacterium]MBT6731108.1 alpha-glucan family phosphorylase [Candidatus Peregrinibacteria bacterium]
MSDLKVAYFSMEIGLRSDVPTYAGGLGMLAGDMMRSCADMGVNAACVTMCWQHGYMKQTIHADGSQTYEDRKWNPIDVMKKVDKTISVTVEGREIKVGAWIYDVAGIEENIVPVIFLDTNLEENSPQDREITKYLYGGDGYMRLKQEVVLGIGGVRMLRALNYNNIGTFHMNEGHAAFLTLELLKERDYKDELVRPNCAFTTHTPVKAGHDVFSYEIAHRVVGDMLPWHIKDLAGQDSLSMTLLAMHLSHYTHGVSEIHGEVSASMFPDEEVDYITNGIHHRTWACDEMSKVLDKYASGWKKDPSVLTVLDCDDIPDKEIWNAHQSAKKRLIEEVNKHTVTPFDSDTLTIASARRVVPYKRPELLYQNLERLKEVAGGRVQIIHAGNAHPSDKFSQDVIQRMVQRSSSLKDFVKIVFLENYNPDLAKLMVSGADVWLNTPMRLFEASGTSGMKACVNGVLNLSTLDGWWIEGYSKDPESGWRIGPLARATDGEAHRKIDAEDLYTQLQFEVIPEYYYENRIRWIRRMKRAIGLVGFFNTNRCVNEYIEKAWTA